MLELIGMIIILALIGSIKLTGDKLSRLDMIKLIAAILLLIVTGLFWRFVFILIVSLGINLIVKKL